MPIYEYNCGNCGDDFECIVFRTDEPVECPKCGNKSAQEENVHFRFFHRRPDRSSPHGFGLGLFGVLVLELLFLLVSRP